ncbi:hypothetical protein Y032_0005g2686 [Ancylostoma ceylanicum]|uniref:Uncharacterized protein n=1 Tax=Ancylostoma ceylanicum TaxID=53326 RepID=A0A016VUT1_9BILA|nr:hypothetical protein Y032_0005g2686 [Ancylostoma ceylanicum]
MVEPDASQPDDGPTIDESARPIEDDGTGHWSSTTSTIETMEMVEPNESQPEGGPTLEESARKTDEMMASSADHRRLQQWR